MEEFDKKLAQYGILAKNAQKSIEKDRVKIFDNAIIETIDFKTLQEKGIKELHIKKSEIYNIVFSKENDISVCFDECLILEQINAKKLLFKNKFNFIKCIFNKKIDFSYSIFSVTCIGENVSFEKCTFNFNVFFNETHFETHVNFEESTFEERVIFNRAFFLNQETETNCIEVSFLGATFKDKADFCDITFKSMIDFSYAIFENEVRFCYTNFESVVHFSFANFKGVCDFSSTKFLVTQKKEERNRICFDNTEFEDIVHFSSAQFESKVLFCKSVFKSKVNFNGAEFLTSHYDAEINNFDNVTFESDAWFNDIIFNSSVLFNKCKYKGNIYIRNITSKQQLCFYESLFLSNVYFNNSHFKDYVNFHECEFEKIACFYGVIFDKTPNFSQAVFKGNLNVVNTNLNFTFGDLQGRIKQEYKDFNKDKKEEYQKSLDKFANDFRDSFRNFKSTLIKDNNFLDASNFHKYELYCKELELKNKKATTFKDIVDRYQLLFYRKLCDHHTDLLKAFHNLLIVIMLFSMFSFVFDKFKQPSHIENDIKYNIVKVDSNENYIFKEHNKTTYNLLSLNIEQDIQDLNTLLSEAKFHFVFGFSLLVIFIALLNKKYLWLLFLPLFWGAICCIGFPISMISHFLIILLFVCIFVFIMIFDSKAERFLFVGISYMICVFVLLIKPSLLLPALGSFLDKDSNATYPLLLSLSVVYFILVVLVLFSLQKTARKNSIVPS